MTYEIEIDMTSNLSAKTVEHMVISLVEQHTGKKVSKVETKYHDGKFAGYDVIFVSEKKQETKHKKPYKVDKSFKLMHFD